MNYSIIAIVVVAMIGWAATTFVSQSDAMQKCMERQSRDTCISNLR